MGRGDRKTTKGKRSISSYGNIRSSATKKEAVVAAVKKEAVKKAPAKKAAVKKATSK